MDQNTSHTPKFGARIFAVSDSTALIKQTISRGPSAEYIIDTTNGGHREKFASLSDDVALAQAVREALLGNL